MAKKVYTYAISNSGQVIERTGIISTRTARSIIVTVDGGQRILCGREPGVIVNDKMWSSYPAKNVYVEKMLDVLLDRRAIYQDRLEATARRIKNIRQCAG